MEVTLEAEDAMEASREDAESTANFAPLKESASLEHELRDCVLQSAGDSVASSGGTTPVPILSRYKSMQLRGLGLDSSTERCKPRLVLKKANSPECGGTRRSVGDSDL